MNNFFGAAQFTFDFAAPVERAVTPLHHEHGLGAVAAATAHEVAAVDSDAGVVTGAPVRARDAEPRVLLTEARRCV